MKIGAKWLLLSLLFVSGCYIPEKWRFVQLNQANPVANAGKIYFARPTFTNVVVEKRPVAEYRSTLKPQQQASFDGDLQGLVGHFSAALIGCKQRGLLDGVELAAAPGPDTYVAEVHVEDLMLGYWAGIFSGAAKATYLVEIRDPRGQVIESYRNTSEWSGNFSSGERLRFMGNVIAGNLSRFIHARRRGLTEDAS